MPANDQRNPESHEEPSHSGSTTKPGNSAASEDVNVEDVSSRDSGYDGDIEVVKPYAIEEPEDEAPRPVPRLAISASPNDAEPWQGELELVDSMQDLHCDSDHHDLRHRSSNKRGRKRKTPTLSAGAGPGRRQLSEVTPDIQYDGPSASRKRLRRRSMRPKDGLRTTLSPRSSSETDSPASLSLSPQSTDASGTSPSNKPNVSDEMDID